MQNKFTEDEIKNIVKDYQGGMTPKELEKKYNRRDCVIIAKLKSTGVFVPKNKRWTKEEIKILKDNYPETNWDTLLKLLHRYKRDEIITKASKLKIRREVHFWSDNDIEILKEGYEKEISVSEISFLLNHKFSYSAIISKANTMGFKMKCPWTNKELKLLFKHYPNCTSVDDILYLFPNRKKHSIVRMAHKNNLVTSRIWTEEEKQILINEWDFKSDYFLSLTLKKEPTSIKYQRHRLGLLRTSDIYAYKEIEDYIRKRIYSWKIKSIKECGGVCIITGSEKFNVHHLQSFDLIFKEAIGNLNISLKESFEDYTDEELNMILSEFIRVQNLYPLGVCLNPSVHKLFHKFYGYGNNTEEQFISFLKKYNEGTIIF